MVSQKSHPCVVSGLLELHSFCVPDYHLLCDYPPNGGHDPTIAVCIVRAAGTLWKTSTIHGTSVGHFFLSLLKIANKICK